LLAFKQGSEVRLLSRNRLPQNHHYPELVAALEQLPVGECILDGEATGVWGHAQALGYHVFDLPWLEGRDLTALPLGERRELLERLPLQPPLLLVERLADVEPWERARREGWEGVIAKRRDAPYEQRRSPHWLKMKCEASQELVIGGFTEPRGQRRGLGALLVGYFDGPDFVFAGKVGTGTGFGGPHLLELRAALDAIETNGTPFTRATGLPRADVHWVRPERVVQVAFLEWTSHGKLRHPRLLGPRPDKDAREVTRETP
jgi:bifunctional non-homologous end joining protein LigD